ncbi:MAG TPA: RHS repeat-associated core domain-containing protein [Thermoguttaceae bacterium]|nr:RHS repeat-associated core domain-containing protein [Thermoguttaceae bacterium]
MSSAETGPYAEVATTGPDATAVLLTGLPSGVTRWFHVEPIAPAGATEGLNTQAPTVEVSLPERLAGVGINDKSFRIKITSSFTHNEAGYTGEGTAWLLGQGTESGYAVAVAESATAAVWKVLGGTATITDWDSETKEHIMIGSIGNSGAYKVGKVEDLEEEIGDAGYHGFERPAVSDGQWLVVLEDTYQWQDSSWGVDEDYDDFYWTLDVEPIIDLVVNNVVEERAADDPIKVVVDPANDIPIVAYVPKEVEASQASLEVADGSWPEGAVLYMYDAQADQYNEIKIGDATWPLKDYEDTVKYFNLRATAPFSVMQLVLRAGSESDAEWVQAGCVCGVCSGSRPGGNATASGGSLDFSFDLGPVDKGDSGGFVTLHSDRGTAELDTPRSLHLTAHSSVTVNDSALDSSADDGEVLWLTLNGSGTEESKVYVDVHSKEEGSGYSLIFKTVSGETEAAFRRIKFQDGDDEAGGDYAITISRYEITDGGQTETQNGYWLAEWTLGEDGAPGTWEITTGSSPSNLQRVETHTAEYDDLDDTVRIETTTISEPSTQAVVAHVVQKFKKYDWGEERIEQTVYAGYDSGTQQYTGGQTTTWQYHTGGANTTGKLKLTVDAVGHWTYYPAEKYSARGYATEVIEQYGDNAFDEQSETLAADNVTTTYAEYRQWSSTDDDRIELPVSEEVLDLVAKTVITPPSSAGAPVYGYRLTRALANSTLEGYEESWDIEAVTDAPENGYAGLEEFLESVIDDDNSDGHRVWKSWRYPANSTGGDEQYAGRLKKSISPDGVVRLYDYDYANGKTTIQGGLPDSNGDIVEGSKTVTTVNDTGRATQQEQYERKRENGGWILTSLVKYSDFDAYGRSQTATYWFGEEAEDELASSGTGTAAYSTTTTYTACKTDEITGRDGVTTDYDHDSLGRVTKIATEVEDDQQNETYLYTERFAYDAASRQVETRLDVEHDGWDSTLDDDIVTSKSTYDLAGRLIGIEDAEGKKAFFTYRILDVDFDPTAGEDIRTIQESRAYGHDAASGPISVTWTDCQGRGIRSFTAKLDDPQDDWNGSAPTGEEALDELSRAVYQHNWRGRQTAVLAYHDLTGIALSGAGTAGSAYTWGEGASGTNYYQSTTTYAHTGEVQYATDPAGDIGFLVYDGVGRPIETWAGTELGGSWTATDPNAGTGGDMTKVSETFYDDDQDRDAAEYDWRMSPTRQTGLKPLTTLSGTSADYTYVDYSSALDYTDNGDATDDFRVAWSKPALGAWSKRVYSIEGKLLESLAYDHTGDTLGDLLAKVATQYDGDTGRLTSARGYEVSSGSAGDYLQTTYSYDAFGRQVKTEQAGGGYTKVAFDDLGRVERAVYASNEGNDTDVIDPTTGEVDFTDDVVLTETVYEYDDVGDVLLATVYQRAADATATGLLSDALASQSRATYAAAWYDNAHRVTHLADYGTNGGTAIPDTADGDFDPDTVGTQHYGDFTPQPDSSDNIIVTRYEYDDSGRAYKVTANDGAATVSEYDALGRTTAVIQNYDDGSPGGDSGETDVDLVTRYTFDTSGRLKEQTADLPGASDDQATRYFYSGEFDADHDGTVVKSHSMLRATRYPDSTLTDQNVIDILDEAPGAPDSHDFVAATYNAAGLAATTTDQREVVHTYAFDEIGRLTADTVTLPEASDVDDSVLAITSIYDALGRVAKITSHSDAEPDTDGFTDAVNQIEYAYDGWGNLVTEKQEHDGAVDGNTLTVQYAYDWDDDPQTDEAVPYLRLSMVTYPDGREVYYNYASGIADDISRVSEIADDDLNEGGRTRYAVYGYLGAGGIVTVEHPAVSGGLTLDYGSDGSGGWDQFGRVTGQTWTNSAETTTFDDFAYTYDRASNRVTRDLSLTTGLDEKYTYDGLNRLANTERGTLTGSTITDLAFEQDWSLDALGNWAEFNQDDDGVNGWDLEQTRDHNKVNEIEDIDKTQGPIWIVPVYDATGNMLSGPVPGDEDARQHYKWDAWNRMIAVYADDDQNPGEPGDLVATYRYDGSNRRIQKTVEGASAVTYDYYYDASWQILEVHRSDYTYAPYEQYVWDIRYIDAPVLRDRDTADAGTLDETLYFCNDANMNVTAVVDTDGDVVERYQYDPYGKATFLAADWSLQENGDVDGISSNYDNEILYCGYHLDTETGLYHVRHRMYHPTLGRWLSRDPIGYADGMSLYAYVSSSPPTRLDPLGLSLFDTLVPYDKPEKIRKQLGVTIVDPSERVGAGEIKGIVATKEIHVGTEVKKGTAKDAQVGYHETVAFVGTRFTNGAGEGGLTSGGVHAYYPPPWKEAEADLNNTPYPGVKFGYYDLQDLATGWHNLAMMVEFAAYAQRVKPGEDSPCCYAKSRWSTIPEQPLGGAHVAPPDKTPIPWQEDLRKMIRWMCKCEDEGTTDSYDFSYDTGVRGWADEEQFKVKIGLKCLEKEVIVNTFSMQYWD